MPTKIISIALSGALGAAIMGMPAYAGGACGGQHCGIPVQVIDGPAPKFGPLTIRNQNPLGHLRSVDFQRAPNVSITRVHGLAPTAALSDAPSSFTGGCHPTSVTLSSRCRCPRSGRISAASCFPSARHKRATGCKCTADSRHWRRI